MSADKIKGPISFSLLKGILDWSLRLIPSIFAVLVFVFQFYSSQQRMQDRSKQNEDRITHLETVTNEMKRDLTDAQGALKAQKQQIEDDEKFYVLTHK